MTLRFRVMSVLGLLILLSIGIGGLGLYGVHQSNDGLRDVYESQSQTLEKVSQLSQMTERSHLAIASILLDPMPANIDAESKLLKTNMVTSSALLEELRTNAQGDAETKLIAQLSAALAKLNKEGFEPALQMLESLNLDGVNQQLKSKIIPLLKPVNDEVLSLRKRQVDNARVKYEQGTSLYKTLRFAMFVAILLAAGICGAAGYILVRNLYRQLGGEPEYSSSVARRIATGDLSGHIEVAPNDNHSLLAAMQSMQSQLAATVTAIRQATETINTGATEIAQGNMDLSTRTEVQASSLEQTANSIRHLTDTVRTNAANADLARNHAGAASEVAAQGGAVVTRVVSTMEAINDSSRKIADITGVIDSIAFQTNILALNAAVEAARAGEQGRGFAVVATEVRTLAQRSAAAAKEIKTLIGDSTDKVNQGTLLVDEAGKTMDKIVESVQRVGNLITEIAAASAEQTGGIEQVNHTILQMDQTTQQNSALVEEAAAAAASLQEQADALSHHVHFFKLGQEQGVTSMHPMQSLSTHAPPSNASVTRHALK